MKYLLSAKEAKAIDQYMADQYLMETNVLMERAALALYEEIKKQLMPTSRICIVCGKGNNGGDGYVLARLLHADGYIVDVFSTDSMSYSTDTNPSLNALQSEIIKRMGMQISTDFPADEYDIIVDAIFGIGLNRDLSEHYIKWISHLNQMHGFKIAVDLPSGLDADYGTILSEAFCADYTITFGYYKKAHFLYPAKELCGQAVCKKIGVENVNFAEANVNTFSLDETDIDLLLPKRIADSYKGNYKKVGVWAGNNKIGGAVMLAAKASFMTGVGYVKIYSDIINRNPILSEIPEALFYSYQENSISDLFDCTAIAIGPGIGTTDVIVSDFQFLLEHYDGALVIDADAITILSNHNDLYQKIKLYAKAHTVVITPHKGELDRLYGDKISKDKKERLIIEKEFATNNSFHILCKDADTRIYTTNGNVYINNSGNHGMATAGSGDVLTGIIAGLLAQKPNEVKMIPLGAYIHGLAGDFAAKKHSAYSMKAGDIADEIQTVLKEYTKL